MKRNNILAKKRLMRTRTHILTLLIAATMILSSAVTMASVNENIIEDTTNPTAPASVEGYELDGVVPGDPEIDTVLDRVIRYPSSSKGDIVYDNGMDYIGLGASHQCSAYDAKCADDFTFSEDTTVGDVHWIGGYWNGAVAPFDWAIEFFVDDGTGTAPGALHAGPFSIPNADITMVDIGGQYFEMSAFLPGSVDFDGGEKYWIAIWGDSEYPPQSGFGYHSTIIGAEASFMSIYFGVPDWTPQGRDHAFMLTGIPNDVYVEEIISPTDASAFCPCTPVEVTVTNAGLDDQIVPVSVEIRRNLMCEDFEAPPIPPAPFPPVDPMFGPWSIVDGFSDGFTWEKVNIPTYSWGIAGNGFPSGAISGDFAYVNSDGPGPGTTMIEDLITPALPTGSGAPYIVEFDYEIYGWGEDITVWIAPTSTGPWTMAGPPILSGGEVVGHWFFDLMAAAPVMTWPAVYVSWTYNDYGSWGYDAAIDNIMIYDIAAPWMVFETFGAAAPPSFPPAGWTEYGFGGDWDQVTSETAYPFRAVPRDNSMAEFMSGLMTGDALLETMAFDFTDACHPMVSFYMWHDTYGSDDSIEVLANGVAIDSFERLCCPDCPDGWIEHIVDLGAYAGMSGIYIGFLGVSDANPGAYNLQIDDVCVYDQEYYEEMDVDVPSFDTVNVEFPEWCICNYNDPAWADTYEDVVVIASTHLDDDEIPSNDAVTEDVTIYIPFLHDVASISIDEPVDTVPIQTFEMCGTIKNVGQYEECCFSTYMKVYREDPMASGPGFNVLFEDFEGSFPPAGWSIENPGTATWNTNTYYTRTNYIGTGICADIDSDRAGSAAHTAGELRTPTLDLGVAKTATLEFDAAYNWIGGAEYFEVDVSDDGGSNWNNELHWAEDHSAYGPGEHVTIDLTPYTGSSDVIVRFVYDDMNVWAWWMEIDNVDINVGSTKGFFTTPEWEDDFCIDDIDICEEVQICFNDWTPALPYPDCGALSYKICMNTVLCDPMDDNPVNDIVCDYLTVEFWRDVSIKEITGPADDDRDILGYNDGNTENAYSWTDGSPWTMAIELSDPELASYRGHDLTEVIFNCGCDDYGFYAEDYEIRYATGSLPDISTVTPIASGTASATGWTTATVPAQPMPATGSAFVIVTFTTSVGFPAGFDYDNGDIRGQHMLDTLTTNTWISLQDLWGSPAVWGLDAGLTVGGGPSPPPPADLYIPCGEQDFCATFENLGTFDEPGCIIDWALYEWIGGPVLVIDGSDTIDLDVGEVEDYCFGSFDFVAEGTYILEIELIAPVMDCYLDNNVAEIVIGVDCCPPETTFVLDPEQPNGENNWYTTSVTATVDAVDCCDPPHIGSGVKEIKYKVNGVEGTITGDHGTITVSDDGVHLVELWAIDNAGNEETDHHTFEVAIDSGDPIIDLVYDAYEDDTGWQVDFTATASDATSGIDRVEFYIGSSLESTLYEAPFVWSFAWEDDFADEDFKATVYDNAGNSDSVTIDGGGIEAQPYFNAQPSLPVWLVQQQAKNI